MWTDSLGAFHLTYHLASFVVCRRQRRRCATIRQPDTSPCTCSRPAPSATCPRMLPPCCAPLPAQRQPAKRALKLRRGTARLQLAHQMTMRILGWELLPPLCLCIYHAVGSMLAWSCCLHIFLWLGQWTVLEYQSLLCSLSLRGN